MVPIEKRELFLALNNELYSKLVNMFDKEIKDLENDHKLYLKSLPENRFYNYRSTFAVQSLIKNLNFFNNENLLDFAQEKLDQIKGLLKSLKE